MAGRGLFRHPPQPIVQPPRITASGPITGTVAIAFQAPAISASGTVVGSGVPHFRPYDAIVGQFRVAPHSPQVRWLKFQIPSAVSGTAAIAFQAPAVSASGAVVGSGVPYFKPYDRLVSRFRIPPHAPQIWPLRSLPLTAITGTASITFQSPSVAATGTVVGSGVPYSTPYPQLLAGSLWRKPPQPLQRPPKAPQALAISGSASITFQAPSVAASGSVVGSGVPFFRAAQLHTILVAHPTLWRKPHPQFRIARVAPSVAVSGSAAITFAAPTVSASGNVTTVGIPAFVPIPRRMLVPAPPLPLRPRFTFTGGAAVAIKGPRLRARGEVNDDLIVLGLDEESLILG